MADWIETVENLHAASASEDRGKVKYTRVFLVHFTDQVPLYTVFQNRAALGLPAYNSSLSSAFPNTTATTYDPSYEGDSYDIITVKVGYEFNSYTGTSPVGKRKFNWTGRVESREYFYDSEDNAAVNTAGEPFPQIPKRKEPVQTWKMTLNVEPNTARSAYASLIGRINQDAHTLDGDTYDEGTLLITSVDLSEIQEEAGYQFKTITAEGEYHPDGHNQDIESRGRREVEKRDGTGTTLRDITKGTVPVKVEIPWPLDEDGIAQPSASDDPATVTLKPYYKADASGLFEA